MAALGGLEVLRDRFLLDFGWILGRFRATLGHILGIAGAFAALCRFMVLLAALCCFLLLFCALCYSFFCFVLLFAVICDEATK